MSTPEATIVAPDASGTTESSTPAVADSSSAGTPPSTQDTAGSATAGAVQDQSTTEQADPLAGVPSIEELQTAADRETPYAKSLIQLRNALEPLKTQYAELQEKWKTFEPVSDRFQSADEVQQLVDMRESLMGWERGPQGELVPATQNFVSKLDPARQSYVFADLADAMVTGQDGQQIRRIDQIITRMGQDPSERANIARALGLVEPSAVAPQWQATEEQLGVVRDDLKDTFTKLPYDKREALSTNEPDFINEYLEERKLKDDLIVERERRTQEDADRQTTYREQLQAEAAQAGDAHVTTQLNEALTTFHNSVVDQCKIIEPIDPQNPPEGMDATQVAQYNQLADKSNKAEAVTVTLAVVGLINEDARQYVVPMLKEIGMIDDKFLAEMTKAGKAFGDNARNFAHLTHTQKIGRNGTYQPGSDVTMLNTESTRNLKLLVYYANQVKSKLIEAKSQAFGMKATGHNTILNGAAATRPGANGGTYDPTTAATQQPKGWMTRDEIAASIR